jgi:hypothetical protein
MTIDLATGNTTFAGNIDPSAGVVAGAVSLAPEPGSAALVFSGLVLSGVLLTVRRHGPKKC